MTVQGSWIWYELMTGDATGARTFYEAVVGWTITPGTEPPMHYGFIGNFDGQMTGGLLPLTAEMTANGAVPMWLGYIGVDDCAAAVAAIAAGCCSPRSISMWAGSRWWPIPMVPRSM